MKFTSIAVTLVATAVHAASDLRLARNYAGATFFDEWTFQNGIDANTTGNVLFQTREQARDLGLTYVNGAGNVIVKVDNTIDGTGNPTFGRPSVRLLSNVTIRAGSLVTLDAVHMPYGCSVWGAFWTTGPLWPDNGEIDIVEQVNLSPNNRYALHTLNGCMHPPAATPPIESGRLISTDCFNQTNGNQGCIVEEAAPSSFGADFARDGGGVFATLWDDAGIRIWFFPRRGTNTPADLNSENPDPSTWPLPSAFYPSSSCDTTRFFSPQTIILVITVCGNYAGAPQVFNPGCTGVCTDLVWNPNNYHDAYFEIRSMRIYSNDTSLLPPPNNPRGPNAAQGKSITFNILATSLLSFALVTLAFYS